MATQTKAQVKAVQTALNAKGANLVVDGIAGAKTNAAIAKYSSSPSTTSGSQNSSQNKSTVANKSGTTQGTSYSSVSSGKSSGNSLFANPLSGGFFKNVKQGFDSLIANPIKDAITSVSKNSQGANALNGTLVENANTNVYNDKTKYSNLDLLLNGGMTPGTFSGQAVKDVKNTLGMKAKTVTATEPNTSNSQNIDLSLGLPNSDTIEPNKLEANINSGVTPVTPNSVISKTSTPNADGSTTTLTADITPASTIDSPSSTSNATILNNINTLNTGLKSDLNGGSTAWMSPGSKGEFQNTKTINYATNVASQFTTPEQAVAFYKTPEGINSLPQGVKAEDIISKVTPVVNGVVPSQTTPEYLTSLGKAPASLSGEKKATEGLMKNIANYATDYEKTILSQAEQDKITAKNTIDKVTAKELRDESTVRDRANLAIDKLKAQQQADDAQIEINRIQGKTNLIEFLAKIGALRTDGAAQTGLEVLEQKYQAQRLTTKNSYEFAIRDAQIDMTDKLNALDDSMEEKIININSDLSKTERQVQLEVMKTRFDTKMKGLEYVSKFQDSIKAENEKSQTKQDKITGDYNKMLLDLMVDKNIPFDIAKTMINSKGQVNATSQNASNIKSFSIKLPEPKPDYKGEILNLGKDTKIAQKIFNATGLGESDIIQLQKELQQGYSLEQIAKNNGMPTNIFNALRPYVVAQK